MLPAALLQIEPMALAHVGLRVATAHLADGLGVGNFRRSLLRRERVGLFTRRGFMDRRIRKASTSPGTCSGRCN